MLHEMPSSKIIACAHHKSGSGYTVKSFRTLSSALGRKLWMRFYDPDEEPADWDICLHQHGQISDLLDKTQFRGWHCVRNPRALIYSAALYHQKCREPWVDVPLQNFTSHTFWSTSKGSTYSEIKNPEVSLERKCEIMGSTNERGPLDCEISYDSGYDLDGRTYREFLTELPSLRDKLLFEMRSYSRGVINDMLTFPNDCRFYRIKIEDISFNTSMTEVVEALKHMSFEGDELVSAIDLFSENCLWKLDPKSISHHATTRMSEEWRDHFNGDVEREYRLLFGQGEEKLGYFF